MSLAILVAQPLKRGTLPFRAGYFCGKYEHARLAGGFRTGSLNDKERSN